MKSFNGKWQLVGLVMLGSEYDDMNLIQTGKKFNSPFNRTLVLLICVKSIKFSMSVIMRHYIYIYNCKLKIDSELHMYLTKCLHFLDF